MITKDIRPSKIIFDGSVNMIWYYIEDFVLDDLYTLTEQAMLDEFELFGLSLDNSVRCVSRNKSVECHSFELRCKNGVIIKVNSKYGLIGDCIELSLKFSYLGQCSAIECFMEFADKHGKEAFKTMFRKKLHDALLCIGLMETHK